MGPEVSAFGPIISIYVLGRATGRYIKPLIPAYTDGKSEIDVEDLRVVGEVTILKGSLKAIALSESIPKLSSRPWNASVVSVCWYSLVTSRMPTYWNRS
jgi:hypothetical protein